MIVKMRAGDLVKHEWYTPLTRMTIECRYPWMQITWRELMDNPPPDGRDGFCLNRYDDEHLISVRVLPFPQCKHCWRTYHIESHYTAADAEHGYCPECLRIIVAGPKWPDGLVLKEHP